MRPIADTYEWQLSGCRNLPNGLVRYRPDFSDSKVPIAGIPSRWERTFSFIPEVVLRLQYRLLQSSHKDLVPTRCSRVLPAPPIHRLERAIERTFGPRPEATCSSGGLNQCFTKCMRSMRSRPMGGAPFASRVVGFDDLTSFRPCNDFVHGL